LNGGDGGEIAIHRDDHVEARGGGMAVRVVEAGENGFAGEVEFLGCCGREVENVIVAADGEESAMGNGDGLRARLRIVHGEDIGVVEDQLGLFDFEREYREGSHGAQEFPTRGVKAGMHRDLSLEADGMRCGAGSQSSHPKNVAGAKGCLLVQKQRSGYNSALNGA